MSNDFIKIEYNDADVQALFQRLIDAGSNLEPAWHDIGELLTKSTKDRFTTGDAPDGTPWTPNSETTLARKKGDKPLIGEFKSLSTEFNYSVQGNALEFGSPMKYAAMQQFGGSKSEFPNLWGDIPARPFIGVSSDDKDKIMEILREHLAGAV